MTQLAALKASSSLHDVAHLLGYKPRRYTQLQTPKRRQKKAVYIQ
jgi:hypothetical protein